MPTDCEPCPGNKTENIENISKYFVFYIVFKKL